MIEQINIGQALTQRAFLNPDREAIVDLGSQHRMNFGELNRQANRCSHAITALGLRKGDRLALLCQNRPEFYESFFGPAKQGIVLMPLNWRLTADELAFILKDGGAKAIVFDAEFAPVVEEIRSRGAAGSDLEHFICVGDENPDFSERYDALLADQPEVEPDATASGDDNLFIMYTSGTTGNPKGVVHTHHTVFWSILTLNNSTDQRPIDRYLVLLPLFHVGALTPMITGIYIGNTQVIMRSFDPAAVWRCIEEEKINSTLAVPAMLGFMLQVPGFESHDWSSLRFVSSGAAPLPVSTIERYLELGIEINQVYGMTESGGPGCIIGPEDAVSKIGSTGKAFFHTLVKIVDGNGKELPPGEPGEVLIRGPHIMKEYWNRPEATRETIVDGWLHSGDVATMDAEGFVTIADRKKDMIISGGENVYPAEIENVLLQHPGVADVAVIGQPSEKWGESPLAVVVAAGEQPGVSDVMGFCEGKLARYKLPKHVEFVDMIPRNPSGKILKRVLREQFPGPAAE